MEIDQFYALGFPHYHDKESIRIYEHKRRMTRQTDVNMHRGDQLGERQDRGTGTEMDTEEVP